MAKPIAPEDICNLSLDLLKQSPLNSITTPVTSSEYIMARWYDMERMAALRAHPWKFAIKRVLLTPNLTATPAFGYAYAYDLPTDYIRKVTIGDDYLSDLRMKHVIESGQILTASGNNTVDNTTLFFRYIFDCTTVTQFDALFVKYFALMMAVDLSPKFAVSVALGRDLKAQFEDTDTLARTVNGQDAPITRIQQSRFITKRRGLPGGVFATKYNIFES